MAAKQAVPARASGDSLVDERWFRFLVRAAIALLAFLALWFGADRYRAFFFQRAATLRSDDALWFSWVAATVIGGLLFGLATWVPFARVRFLPSRLALAAVALVPLAHAWWIWVGGHPTGRLYWFDGAQILFPTAALAGVAIGSAFVVGRVHPAAGPTPVRASNDTGIRALWFRLLVRTALALLAFGALWFAAERFKATFLRGAEVTSDRVTTGLQYDGWSVLSWAVATVAAGLLFGLATGLPFAKVRFWPSRLLLAAAALIPLVHFWWTYLEGHGGPGAWYLGNYWFDSIAVQFELAALAGVAIASGLRAKR